MWQKTMITTIRNRCVNISTITYKLVARPPSGYYHGSGWIFILKNFLPVGFGGQLMTSDVINVCWLLSSF